MIIGWMWTLKYEINSPKFYELLIKTELKVDTALELNNFYNHIKMCLNAVTKLLEDLLTAYQSIKTNYKFEEYFVPDHDHRSYYWNAQTHTSLGHYLFEAMANDTCVKSSMGTQAYKVVNNHAHEISGW